MNGGNNKVPKLRFPEFRDAGEWEEKRLNEIAQKTASSVTFQRLDETPGEYPVFGASGIVGYVDFYNSADIHISIVKDGAGVGRVFLCPPKSSVLGTLDSVIAIDENQTPFVFYWLSQISFEPYKIGSTIPHIYFRDYGKKKDWFPTPPEQQKIADCLSSLDDLITVQTQKLAHLKTHKKGLMQQLFPAEGETQPKLRFPEFRDAGDWQEKRLGDIGNVSMCKRVLKHETSVSGDIPFYKIGTFGKHADAYIPKELYERYRDQYSFPQKGEILISASGTIGRIVVYDGSPAYFQDSNIVWISNNEKIATNAFLLFCYGNTKWKTSDNTIARLYNDNLRSIEIPVPSLPEQQKIADCLSSLDDLITAQGQKLAHLKTHKKGLMQQLFPAADEVNG